MKKILLFFLAFSFSLAFLTGCQNGGTNPPSEPQSAGELWETINAAMDQLDSYEADGTGTMSLGMMGIQMTTDMKMKNIVSGAKGNDYYDYSLTEVSVKMTMPGESEPTEITSEKSVEAFHNGKIFISTESEERTHKYCSALTKDAYITYRNAKAQELDQIDFNQCVKSEFKKNDDGTWSLQYSGYAKKTVNAMVESFGMTGDSPIDFEIEDMEVSIQADQNYQVKEMKIRFIFDEDDSAEVSVTAFEIVTQYTNFNAATPVTDQLNPADYTELPDCRIVFGLDAMLKEIEAKGGSFTLDVTKAVDFPVLQKVTVSKESDIVTFGEKDGGYFYHVVSEHGSDKYDISYENGTQTSFRLYSSNSPKESKPQTEEEAKSYISKILHSINFFPSSVSDVSIFEDQVYVIQCDSADTTDVSAAFASYRGEIYSVRQTIYVTVEDGKITQIKSNTFAEGVGYRNSQPVDMLVTVSSTCTFHQ